MSVRFQDERAKTVGYVNGDEIRDTSDRTVVAYLKGGNIVENRNQHRDKNRNIGYISGDYVYIHGKKAYVRSASGKSYQEVYDENNSRIGYVEGGNSSEQLLAAAGLLLLG